MVVYLSKPIRPAELTAALVGSMLPLEVVAEGGAAR
jgi:hypothetical protein